MFIISKLLFFLGLFLKSAFVALPIFLPFSLMKRKMFKQSEGLYFFLLMTIIAISWRFIYTILRKDSAIATRYISPLNLFLIVLAVPGIFAIVEIIHKLLSRFYKPQRKYIWIILLSATIIGSLVKGLKPRETKYFLPDVGNVIEQICKINKTNNFILFENAGEKRRLVYYSPFLDQKVLTLKSQELLIDRIKKDSKKWDKIFIFTRGKKKGTILQDWNGFAQQKLNTKDIPFKLIKKYPHRKYYYYIFEFNLNCLKNK